MNGSFAAGGGAVVELEQFRHGAIVFFWLAVLLAGAALTCLIWGIVRFWKRPSAQGASAS
ncbi:MAG TPA: hypothetical protein VGI10_28365 [Polyangiaceae bacterium]|jgi:hypothetical protein